MEILGLLLALLLGVYFLPTVIALRERPQEVLSIFLFNLALGWTVVGWFLALAWPGPIQRRFSAPKDGIPWATQKVVVLALGGWTLTAVFALAWQHFEEYTFEHFQSLLPNGVEITRVDYVGEGGIATPGGGGCGGAFLVLKKETSDAIRRDGIKFFEDRLRARKYQEGLVHYIFRGWRETPLSQDVKEGDEWSRGLNCMGLGDDEQRKLEEVLKQPGSFWSRRDDSVTVVIPALDRVIITYFEL